MASLLSMNITKLGLIIVVALLLSVLIACVPVGPQGPIGTAGAEGPAGPAGPAGPEGAVGRSAPEGGTALMATISGSDLIIAGSGFPPGKGVWLNIPGAASQGRDVFLTKELAIVNGTGAFAVTLPMSAAPIGGKSGLKPGVYTIKSVGGEVVATAPLIIRAPTEAATPAPTKAATPATIAITVAQATAQGVTRLDVNYGAVPATGWKWGVADITIGSEERIEDTTSHGFPWIFFVVRGSTEVGTDEGRKVFPAGGAFMVSQRQDHSHRFFPQSQVLAFRPTERPMGEFHRGTQLFESDTPLDIKVGQNYSIRIREFALLSRGSEDITLDANFGYVIDGTLTIRSGDKATTQQAGKVFVLPSNIRQVISNEGATPLRFILVDLHQ